MGEALIRSLDGFSVDCLVTDLSTKLFIFPASSLDNYFHFLPSYNRIWSFSQTSVLTISTSPTSHAHQHRLALLIVHTSHNKPSW